MPSMTKTRPFAALVTVMALSVPTHAVLPANGQERKALRIVVVAGEDAVNIVQQKTAVAPVVEVRDENDLPVAGVLVRFGVREGGRATFFGGTTTSATTNAAGRATALAFRPAASGTVQIDVTATTVQGQTATATISQTNYATMAEATQAGRAPSSSSGSGTASAAGGTAAGVVTAGAAGGGGMSAGMIGLIAGGAALGTVGVVAVAGNSGNGGGPPRAQSLSLTGPFSLDIPISSCGSFEGIPLCCTAPRMLSGSLRLNLQTQSSGAVGGTMDLSGTDTLGPITCTGGGSGTPFPEATFPPFTTPVTGTASSLTALFVSSQQAGDPLAYRFTFAGALANGVVTGTLQFDQSRSSGGIEVTSRGSTAITAR